MKKIILLLGITLLCGCENDSTSINMSPEGSIPFVDVTHFEYKNHQYIKFLDGYAASSSVCGVVHDPDCKYCNVKEYEN